MSKIKGTLIRIKERNALFLKICDKYIKLICGRSLTKEDVRLLKKAIKKFTKSHYKTELQEKQKLPQTYYEILVKRTLNKNPVVFAFRGMGKSTYIIREDLEKPGTFHNLKEHFS
jgi:hypothetical protein